MLYLMWSKIIHLGTFMIEFCVFNKTLTCALGKYSKFHNHENCTLINFFCMMLSCEPKSSSIKTFLFEKWLILCMKEYF
jgi:hypothetical protein